MPAKRLNQGELRPGVAPTSQTVFHFMSKLILLRAVPVSLIAFLLAMAMPAGAQDFTVNSATTTTNGGYTINGGDTLTITPSGSIATTGAGSGVHATGSDNTITNNGTVTTGGGDFGIFDDYADGSPIINNGTVRTEGNNAFGLYDAFSNNSPITNSGTVTTTGFNSYGLYGAFSDNSPITNSGTVTTAGDNAFGIYGGISDNSPITNSGSVTTTGDGAFGIYGASSNGSPVTNSGLVVSEKSDAFRIANTGGVLNLVAPAYIGGAINLDAPTTVNITTGPSHSVLWNLSTGTMTGGAPNISGTVPWFYDSATKRFATYDPSGFAGSLDALGDMTGLLSTVGRAGPGKAGLWASGFGGGFTHAGDAMTLPRDITQYGAAFGYRGRSAAGFDWDFMGGYLNGKFDASSRWTKSYDVTGRGWFAGINGRMALARLAIAFGFTGGWLDYSQSRFVNDNLATTGGLTLGRSWANASYDGWFAAPEIAASTRLGQLDGWTLMPSARVRYAGQWLGGYAETGSNANATVAARTLGLVEANAELALAKTAGFGTVTVHFGYLARHSVGDGSVPVTLLGITDNVGFGDASAQAGYVGVDYAAALAKQAQLNLNVTGFYGRDLFGVTGMGRLALLF